MTEAFITPILVLFVFHAQVGSFFNHFKKLRYGFSSLGLFVLSVPAPFSASSGPVLSLVYQVPVIPVINRAVYLGKQRVEKVLIPL